MQVLIDEGRIAERVAELAATLRRQYQGRDLVCVGVLKGCFIFMADLLRQLGLPVTVDFLGVASYGGSTEPAKLRVTKDVDVDLAGRDVLVIEDICDTGVSLGAVVRLLGTQNPASIGTCVLLDKPSRRKVDFNPDYVGFSIPDAFVVGYGLDYAERHRHLPHIATLPGDAGEQDRDTPNTEETR